MDKSETIAKIRALLDGRLPLSIHEVRRWADSSEGEILKSALEAISNRWQQFEPKLSRRDFGEILFQVWVKTLSADPPPQGLQPYVTARMFGQWMFGCWREKDPEAESCLLWAKTNLATLYRNANADARQCIVQGLLEHLFETDEIQDQFSDWRVDPDLRKAFDEAHEWSRREQ